MSLARVNTADRDENHLLSNGGKRSMDHLRNHSSGRLASESVGDGRILVLYTGGTIGMVRNENGGNTRS